LPAASLTPEELRRRGRLPRHIAIIMDGNGRWAGAQGVPRLMGHRAGRTSVREAVEGCVALGVEVLTLYTFSIENWNRPPREVQALMGILAETLREERAVVRSSNVRLEIIGRPRDLPDGVRAAVDGEPVVFETPLELESVPGALRLLLPAGEEREDDAMHDNPEPTEREQELAQTDRQNEEESQRYPSEGQPDAPDDAEE